MQPNELIQKARVASGLSHSEIASHVGISIDAYCDIEARADELASAISARSAFKLCSLLRLDLGSLLGFPVPWRTSSVDAASYLKSARIKSGKSIETLDLAIGYESGFTTRIEAGEVDLLSYPLELCINLAAETQSPPSELIAAVGAAFEKE